MKQELIDEKSLDYLKEEQKQRRQEIENGIARVEADFRFAVLIMGGIWSWFATNLDKLDDFFNKAAVFLPLLFTLFFYFRNRVIRRSIDTIAEYMRAVEEKFGVTEAKLGWESWLYDKRKDKEKQGRGYLECTSGLFWLSLVAVNLILTVGIAISQGWVRCE